MKRINFKFSPVSGIRLMAAMAPLCAMLFTFSCENMNSIHEEYLNRGETFYIGAADSVLVYPGDRKIKFEWKISADPRITKAVIYWNGRDTSVTIPINRTTAEETWLEHQLDNIAEGEYVFTFVMQDDKGNISKPTEVSGVVLGAMYVENLRNRGVQTIAKLVSGEMEITWEAANISTLQNMVVEYTDRTTSQQVTREIPNSEDITLLEGLDSGDEINIYAVHLPENGLEMFRSYGREYLMPKFERLLDKSRFSDAFKPGDNTTPQPGDSDNAWMNTWGIGDNRDIRQLWDDNTRNDAVGGFRGILHTNDQSGQWGNARFKFPHKFTFDIGVLATLSRIRVWARTDNSSFSGHSPRYIEIWATDAPKVVADFANSAAMEEYYRTTYVVQKAPDNQIQTNPNGDAAHAGQGDLFIAADPTPGIYNWQEDWVKLGDFEMVKPSGMNHNQRNDADNAVWAAGFDFNLLDTGDRYQYIRLVIKYPNWDHTNCINLGEISLYGDDI